MGERGKIDAVPDPMQRRRLGGGIVGREQGVLGALVASKADETRHIGALRAVRIDSPTPVIAGLRGDLIAAVEREGLVPGRQTARQREGGEASGEGSQGHGDRVRSGPKSAVVPPRRTRCQAAGSRRTVDNVFIDVA